MRCKRNKSENDLVLLKEHSPGFRKKKTAIDSHPKQHNISQLQIAEVLEEREGSPVERKK